MRVRRLLGRSSAVRGLHRGNRWRGRRLIAVAGMLGSVVVACGNTASVRVPRSPAVPSQIVFADAGSGTTYTVTGTGQDARQLGLRIGSTGAGISEDGIQAAIG